MNNVSQIPVQPGHSETISTVYTEYYKKIYKYILYRVGDHNIAEDLVSEVFEKVIAKYSTYKSEKAKFSTWLFTIANNTLINYYKRSKDQHNMRLINCGKIESKYRLEDLIIEQELKELLLKAIVNLDERQRNIIAFKFGAGLTNREIAKILNLTESNVGTILYRSLKRLRDILKEQGVIC